MAGLTACETLHIPDCPNNQRRSLRNVIIGIEFSKADSEGTFLMCLRKAHRTQNVRWLQCARTASSATRDRYGIPQPQDYSIIRHPWHRNVERVRQSIVRVPIVN
jgi:hypothetical protein